MTYERRRQHHHVTRTTRSRQTAPSRRAAPANRRRGGPPDRPGTVTAAHREVARRRPRPAPARRPPKKRVVHAPDPRTRARRTASAGTPRWLTRFSAGQPRRRLISTLVAMLLILAAVLVRVGLLQTTAEGDTLRNAASQQWTRDRVLPAQRGTIFDRNGDELALSVQANTVAVDPQPV